MYKPNFKISPLFFLLISVYALFVFSSCHTTKKVIKNPEQHVMTDTVAANQLKADDLLSMVMKNEPQPEWISAKASVNTNINDNTEGFNVSIRMHKDSAIWISINALLGIEAARVLITHDSIKFMDRIHNKYRLADYEYLKDVLRIKIDFSSIQAVLLGNFFNYRNEYKFNSVYVEDKFYILSTLNKRKLKRSLEDKDPNKPVIQDFYVDPTTYRIISMIIEDDRIEKSVKTTYDDFRATDAGLMPFKNTTEISAEKKINVTIEYSKMNLNVAQEMPFRIPSSFEKME